MRQDELAPAPGSKKNRKRVGRGMVVGMAPIQDGAVKGRSPVLAIRCVPVLKAGSCL